MRGEIRGVSFGEGRGAIRFEGAGLLFCAGDEGGDWVCWGWIGGRAESGEGARMLA